MVKIVFDIGKTNIRVAEARNGVLGEVLKLPTPKKEEEWLSALFEMTKKVSKGESVESIAGGVAGATNRERFSGFLKENISARVKVYNDALLAGLGEAIYGAGKDKEIIGYIGFGTGIGTARIAGKKVDSTGFEAGHHIINFSNNETWEENISGHVLKAKYGKYPQELEREIYEDYVRIIALGVYNAILFWSPEVVVLGGALINEKEGFKVVEIANAVEKINEDLPLLPPIRQSELGDNAGLYGAMAIIENEL